MATLSSLQTKLVVGTPASTLDPSSQDDTCREFDNLILAAVDDPELEPFSTLVRSDHRIMAENDARVGPCETGEHEAGRQLECQQSH